MEKEEKKLILDVKGAMLLLERRGIKLSVTEALEKYGNGVSRGSIQNYDIEAPKIIKFIWDLCQGTGLTFEELVKEV